MPNDIIFHLKLSNCADWTNSDLKYFAARYGFVDVQRRKISRDHVTDCRSNDVSGGPDVPITSEMSDTCTSTKFEMN